MLGSNIDANSNLELAKEKLAEYFEIIAISSIIVTKPSGKQYKSDFHNEAIKVLSVDTAEETKKIFKDIETDMGRTYNSKKAGLITIDIDLIFWNDTLVHADYERFQFVKSCINELNE
jgi:2-amino-4-hydroxy-6-hydroxymethyldihydropteridine diphosphokinase